jgi:adenylosuccinate lyase
VQALPITFGHKAAIWLSEMGRNYERMRELEKRVFVGGLVGAVGTQASLGPKAPELEARVMKRLGLSVADINWQPARDRFAEYVSGAVDHRGHAGQDRQRSQSILEHTEVSELYEPFSEGQGRLVTMPHKRNPSSCEAVVGASQPRLRYNAAMVVEAKAWNRARARRLVVARRNGRRSRSRASSMGGMLSMMKYVLEGLDVDVEQMRENLDRLGGFPALRARHVRALGQGRASRPRTTSCSEAVDARHREGRHFRALAHGEQEVSRCADADELRAALDPTTYTRHAPRSWSGW